MLTAIRDRLSDRLGNRLGIRLGDRLDDWLGGRGGERVVDGAAGKGGQRSLRVEGGHVDVVIEAAELARAGRVLALRARREAAGLFAGAYASAFRGGGVEFHESRPYVPGDDVRTLDWNAMARTGEPFVKRYREERDQTLMLALDASASMRFGTAGPKAACAARAAALLAAAAGQAGDRVGLVVFADGVQRELPPTRGAAHTWELIRAAATASARADGGTRLAVGLEAVRARAGPHAVCLLLSDFRDPTFLSSEEGNGASSALAALARRHDVVSLVLHDPREESLPKVGLVRVEDPERPGRTLVLNSSRAGVRARYRRAWAARSRALERALRRAGSDVLWLRTERDPLRSLMGFFRERAAGARLAS